MALKYSDLRSKAKQESEAEAAERKNAPKPTPEDKVLGPLKPAVEPKPPKEMPPPPKIEAKIFGSGDNSFLIPEDFSDYKDVEPEGEAPSASDDVDMDADARDEELVERDIRKATEPSAPAVSKQKPVKSTGKPKATAPKKALSKDDVQMSRMGWMPKCLVELAKQQFPAAKQDDSVAAYIYFHEGMSADLEVPSDVVNAAMNFSGESITVETVKDVVEKDLATVMSQNRMLMRKLDTLQLALAYSIYANAGFAKEIPASPDAIKFLERGVSDLIDKLESDADFRRQREANRNGRPIR